MRTYIVKQPIHDSENNVYGYEVLYNDTGFLQNTDSAAATTIENLLMQFNSDTFLEGRTAFITFTPNLLFRNVPSIFSVKKLVIQIEDNTLIFPPAMRVVTDFKKKGYRVALKGFEFNTRYISALDAVDMVKLNFAHPSSTLDSVTDIARGLGKEVIAYNVDSEEAYQYVKKLGIKFMQGSFIGAMLPASAHTLEHLPSNFFQLMVAVTKEEPDIDEIETIVSRDVTLTYTLIKLVNSAYFALRSRVKSVKQALVILGLGQLKQWIYLLSFKQEKNIPTEFIKLSFLRANFCSELLPFAQGLNISKSEAYLMGMFSTLGLLLQMPLDAALSELSLSDEVKQALLTGEGRCGQLFNLVICYEKADWAGISNYAELLGIPINVISQKYFECVDTVNTTWRTLMQSDEK